MNYKDLRYIETIPARSGIALLTKRRLTTKSIIGTLAAIVVVFLIGVIEAYASPYWGVFAAGGSLAGSYGECHGPACSDIAAAQGIILLDGPRFVYGEGGGATSYVDLRNGTLGASAIYPVFFQGQDVEAQGGAMLIDTLRFAWVGDQDQQVQLTVHFSGAYSSGSNITMGIGAVPVQTIYMNASASWGQSTPPPSSSLTYSLSAPDYYGEALGTGWTRTGFDTFTGTFIVSQSSPALTFSLDIGGVGRFDLMNTATVSLTLPEGVSFTSDSGVFLSQVPVPEPATMLLLGSGLIGLAGYGRKKFFKK